MTALAAIEAALSRRRLTDLLGRRTIWNWGLIALAVALLRALMCGKPDVTQHVRNFVALTENILAAAIAPDGATPADREAAEILERVWFTALIGWATGVDPDDRMPIVMRRAAARIPGHSQ